MGPPDRSKLYADRTVTTVETTATGGIGSSDWRANPTSTGVERHNAPYEKRFEVGNASGDKQRSQDLAAIEARKNRILASTLTDFNNTNTVSVADLHDAGSEDDNLPTEGTLALDVVGQVIVAAGKANEHRNRAMDELVSTMTATGVDDYATIGEPQSKDIRLDINNFAAKPRGAGSAKSVSPSWASIQT